MKRLLLPVVLLGVLSCSESNGPNVLGSMSFTYTGGGGGTFSASGNAPSLADDPPTATAWAVGFIDGDANIGASRPRSGGLVDMAILRIQRTTEGSEPIDATCDIDGGTSCTGMTLFLNFNGNGDTGDFFCGLTSGTIVITEIGDSRAKGTFSGSGSCIAGTGGSPQTFTVTNGEFDVAMVAPIF